MNGYADFVFTPHGWRCAHSYQFKIAFMPRRIDRIHYLFSNDRLRIEGEFLSLPKTGQFCSLPHRYIDWSKS